MRWPVGEFESTSTLRCLLSAISSKEFMIGCNRGAERYAVMVDE